MAKFNIEPKEEIRKQASPAQIRKAAEEFFSIGRSLNQKYGDIEYGAVGDSVAGRVVDNLRVFFESELSDKTAHAFRDIFETVSYDPKNKNFMDYGKPAEKQYYEWEQYLYTTSFIAPGNDERELQQKEVEQTKVGITNIVQLLGSTAREIKKSDKMPIEKITEVKDALEGLKAAKKIGAITTEEKDALVSKVNKAGEKEFLKIKKQTLQDIATMQSAFREVDLEKRMRKIFDTMPPPREMGIFY